MMDKSKEDEEELEWKVLGDGGKVVSVVPFVYTRGTVSVSSLGPFSSVSSSYKTSNPSLPVSLGARHIQEYFNNKKMGKLKFINPQQNKARHEEWMKQSKLIV